VRRLIIDLGGEATQTELTDLASKKFPKRTLSRYLNERLESMKRKELVEEVDEDGETSWTLTDKGKSTTLETKISELDEAISEQALAEVGVTVSNIVGSLDLDRRIDLNALSQDLQNTEYHPERYHSAIFRVKSDSSATIMIPASGQTSITGTTSKEELIDSAEIFLDSLRDLGITINNSDEITIQNIVANFYFQREFDLAALSVGLGIEKTEYEPEQFPGVIYRSSQNAAILIFNSGKCVITGAKSYLEVFEVINEIYDELESIGVELPTNNL